MGGQGSGRWRHKRTREEVETTLPLDVRALARKGRLAPGELTHYVWTEGGQTTRGEALLLADDGALVVWASVAHATREKFEQEIAILTTAQHMGGVRQWWKCPGCGRRCAILYAPEGDNFFDCRKCLGLTYRSQHLGKPYRQQRRLRMLYHRLEQGYLHAPKWGTIVREIAALQPVVHTWEWDREEKRIARILGKREFRALQGFAAEYQEECPRPILEEVLRVSASMNVEPNKPRNNAVFASANPCYRSRKLIV